MVAKTREWLPHERPGVLGAPSTPIHAPWRRAAYALVGVLLGITGGLGNAMVSANLPQIQGSLGLDVRQVNLLPAAYVMLASCANLILIKFRQNFGPRRFAEVFLGIYLLTTLAHLFVESFASALVVRMAAGLSGTALNTLSIFYVVQSFPGKYRAQAILIGMGFVSQITQPLAYLLPTDLLSASEWHGLYLFEFGLCLIAMCGVLALKIPEGDQAPVFEKLDALTIALFFGAMAVLCPALALGRYDWWTDAPWIGWALAAAIGLLTLMFAVEHGRRRPMLSLRQLSTVAMVRFFVVMMLVRVVLSEQGSSAVGFMRYLGMQNEQLHGLYALITLGSVLGIGLSARLFKPANIDRMICTGLLLMAVGAWLNSGNVALTRPAQLVPGQFVLALGSAILIGPAFLGVIAGVVRTAPDKFVGCVMIFVMSQFLGGLIGSAALTTFQVAREHVHAVQLAEVLPVGDAVISGLPAGELADLVTREATVMSYNDVFALVAVMSLLTMLTYLLPDMARALDRWINATAVRLSSPGPLIARRRPGLPANAPEKE